MQAATKSKVWHNGRSYYTTGDSTLHFECNDCGKQLDLQKEVNHCYNCAAKYCDDCFGGDGMSHREKHHRKTTDHPVQVIHVHREMPKSWVPQVTGPECGS